jgi:toxin ParE1/3/4
MPISFHRLAEQELNDAAAYYERQSAGLGAAFVSDVERCSDAVLANPEAGAVVRADVRRRLVRRFPYALLYRIKPHEVRILAVMNLNRPPWPSIRRLRPGLEEAVGHVEDHDGIGIDAGMLSPAV